MKKTITGCDVCKCEIDVSSPDYTSLDVYRGPVPAMAVGFDLCPSCTLKLFAFLYPKGSPRDVNQA